MNKKIAILLSKKGDSYTYNQVTNIIESDNCITVSNSDYNKLAKGEEAEIIGENIDTTKDILLVFDGEALTKSSGIADEKEAMEAAENSLKIIGDNIGTITIEPEEDMVKIKLATKTKAKEEEKTITPEEKSTSPEEKTAEGETKAEGSKRFDIDNIDVDQVISKVQDSVIDQDETVENLVRGIYDKQKAIQKGEGSESYTVLLDGPTGTGKTLTMKQIAKNMDLPISILSASRFTATGYEGTPVEDMLVSLLEKTDGDLEAAQRGIIVLDEFDKLGNADKDTSLAIKIAVQDLLLTFFDSIDPINVEYKGKTYKFDVSNVSFICLGAFTDLREEKEKHLDADGYYTMDDDDYIAAGLKRELVGRLTTKISTKALNKESLKKILTTSAISPLKAIQTKAQNYNANITYDEAVIDEIAEIAYQKNTGARGLKEVVNGIYNILLKDIQSSTKQNTGTPVEIRITHEIIEKEEASKKRKGRTNEI